MIIDLTLMLPFWYLLTWSLLCLYRRHPTWFSHLLALDEAAESEDIELAVWDEKENGEKEGGLI